MRALNGGASAALSGSNVPMALLVDMDLSSPLRLATGGWNLTWGGNTYLAVGGLGAVEPTSENSGEPRGLAFTLSGVPASMVSLVLAENVQGKAVSILVAIFDPATYQVADAVEEWSGRLDTMTLQEDAQSATVRVTAEHSGLDLLRAVPVRYTDTDQQRLFPGDKGFEFVTDQSDKTIIWPSASYFRK